MKKKDVKKSAKTTLHEYIDHIRGFDEADKAALLARIEGAIAEATAEGWKEGRQCGIDEMDDIYHNQE